MTGEHPLRVALLNPYFWPEVRRGSERVIRDLSNGLVAAGHEPLLITGTHGRSSRSLENGLLVIRNRRLPDGIVRRAGYGEPVGQVPGAALALARSSPELAHAFYSSDALAALEWARLRSRPFVFSAMGLPLESLIRAKRLRLWAWRRIVARADAVVVLSAAAQTAIAWLCADPVVIEPGVDLKVFTTTVERARDPMILCPSAIDEPRKRVPLLLDAFTKLRERLPRARLILSRPPDASSAARAAARRPGVELWDLDRDENLVRAYSSAWVTVLPSREEAFGLALAESLACGTPVVGTDEGGITEVIGDAQVGRVFGPDDVSALAGALRDVLTLAEEDSIRDLCRERAEAFSVERSVSAHLSLYERLIEDRPARSGT